MNVDAAYLFGRRGGSVGGQPGDLARLLHHLPGGGLAGGFRHSGGGRCGGRRRRSGGSKRRWYGQRRHQGRERGAVGGTGTGVVRPVLTEVFGVQGHDDRGQRAQDQRVHRDIGSLCSAVGQRYLGRDHR